MPVASKVVDVPAGETVEVPLELTAEAPPPPASTPPAPSPDPNATARAASPPASEGSPAEPPSRAPFWIGVAVTGTLVAATAVTGVLAINAKSNFDREVNRVPTTPSDVSSARTRLRTWSYTNDALLGASIAAAVVTTYLYVSTSPRAVRVGVSPCGATVEGAF
jgi:hypothetical protein